jgi:hypothetical protein
MSELRKAAEMALEALEMTKVVFKVDDRDYGLSRVSNAAEALRQALAQPEQEPVAWMLHYTDEGGVPMRETFYSKDHMEFHKSHNEAHRGLKCQVTPLYTVPPKKEWVGLTEADIYELMENEDEFEFARAIEAQLKQRNTCCNHDCNEGRDCPRRKNT